MVSHEKIEKSGAASEYEARLGAALEASRSELLMARNAQGHWRGELSSSALSTATAVCALTVSRGGEEDYSEAVQAGVQWIVQNVNSDGGWGDTVLSKSNISTTTLCWAVLQLHSKQVPRIEKGLETVIRQAERWLTRAAGGVDPARLSEAILARYGDDRTFSVPILTLCAIAGQLGRGREAWRRIIPLPFELSLFPHRWFAALRLPVVSYALPALIAMGVARHRNAPSRNPVARGLRTLAEPHAMRVLEGIQPTNGGFLEATPLTSFVVMSLAASGYKEHPVAVKGIRFLLESMRRDGSWPIDTDLSTWLTTMAVGAVGAVSGDFERMSPVLDWILGQQYRERHPYTNAAPGGWAWTDLPGGVPDADDTAGALLAIRRLTNLEGKIEAAAREGVEWLLGLQNSDGGIPTFCRGWGKLPFDRSSADITAHSIRAWIAWEPKLDEVFRGRVTRAMGKAIAFLMQQQQVSGPVEGAWNPLWFGNEHNADEINWTYGTSRVLLALAAAGRRFETAIHLRAGTGWLLKTQGEDGGWGGGASEGMSSVEETALAVEALAEVLASDAAKDFSREYFATVGMSVRRGAEWLIGKVEDGTWKTPSPIGFYFAKLWYYERLYPMIMTVGALTAVTRLLRRDEQAELR